MKMNIAALAALGFVSAVLVSTAVAQENGWGTVKGRVTWGGDVPKLPPLDLKANPDKAVCEKKGPLVDETWIVNPKNKGLRHTFVWLQAPKDGPDLPIHADLKEIKKKTVEIDQPLCLFIPHALALREGQTLLAKNGSGLAHNYKWAGHPEVNPGGNVLLPSGAEKAIDDLKADRFPVSIECNIHPWMRGWVRVFSHPYYAVTDEDGNFEFKNAPAGERTLMIWHGSGGWLGGAKGKNGQQVNINAGGTTDLGNLVYPPPAN